MSTMPVSQPNQVHRIVAGFDGSTSSETALRWALAEARRWGGELDVVAAWRYPAEWAEGFNEKWVDDEAALAQRARVSAHDALRRCLEGGDPPSWVHVHAVRGLRRSSAGRAFSRRRPARRRPWAWRAGRRTAGVGQLRMRPPRPLPRDGHAVRLEMTSQLVDRSQRSARSASSRSPASTLSVDEAAHLDPTEPRDPARSPDRRASIRSRAGGTASRLAARDGSERRALPPRQRLVGARAASSRSPLLLLLARRGGGLVLRRRAARRRDHRR